MEYYADPMTRPSGCPTSRLESSQTIRSMIFLHEMKNLQNVDVQFLIDEEWDELEY